MPGPVAAPEVMLYRRDRDLRFLGGEEWWQVTVNTFKRGHTGGRMGQGIVSILSPRELGGPGSGVGGCQTAEGSFDGLVRLLRLSVGLRMETGTQANGDSQG